MSHLRTSYVESPRENSTPSYVHLAPGRKKYQDDGDGNSIEGHKDHNSCESRPLRSTSLLLLSFLADFGCVLVCLGLFVLAMLALRSNGSTLGSYVRSLINTTKIVSRIRFMALPCTELMAPLGHYCISLYICLHSRTLHSESFKLAP
jgi:hypothetical protein